MTLAVVPYPDLDLFAFATTFPAPLGEVATIDALRAGLAADHAAPLARGETVRLAVRDMLRRHGYKPTGRGKPASEYLVRVAEGDGLGSINPAVDACNVVSLHSGLPISVVDLDRTRGALRVAVAAPDAIYVFNPSGQEIRVGGLPCLHDDEGPCANAVKDAQRTKTDATTVRTLSLVWGVASDPERTAAAGAWYRALLEAAGAATEPVATTAEDPA